MYIWLYNQPNILSSFALLLSKCVSVRVSTGSMLVAMFLHLTVKSFLANNRNMYSFLTAFYSKHQHHWVCRIIRFSPFISCQYPRPSPQSSDLIQAPTFFLYILRVFSAMSFTSVLQMCEIRIQVVRCFSVTVITYQSILVHLFKLPHSQWERVQCLRYRQQIKTYGRRANWYCN